MMYRCEWLEVPNDDGTYDALGVRWTEARWIIECLVLSAAFFSFGLGVFILLGGLPAGLVGVIVGVGLFYAGVYCPGRPREIVFWRDGRMETPLGLSTNFLLPWQRWLDHTDIESIEIEQLVSGQGDDKSIYSHGVRIFYACGEMNHVAKNLAPDQAHMLAVRLNQARRKMKDQMQRPDGAFAGRAGERVFD